MSSTPTRRTAVRIGALLSATAAALTIGVVTAPAAGAAVPEEVARAAVHSPGPIAQPAQPAPPAPAAPVTHTVQAGDSLTRIARLFGLVGPSDWRRLYDANLQVAHPDVLHIGEIVTIPSADAVLAERQLPTPPAPAPVVRDSDDDRDEGRDDSDDGDDEAAPQRSRSERSSSDESSEEAESSDEAAPVAQSASSGVWDQLAECESGGNWGIDTGNGYYGGLQFSQSSWEAVGGSGSPADASRDEQIARAEQLQAQQGWDAWPTCSSSIGLR